MQNFIRFSSVFNELDVFEWTRVEVASANREIEKKFEQRAAVKFCVRPKKVLRKREKWTSLKNDGRSGRRTTAVTDENEAGVGALLN